MNRTIRLLFLELALVLPQLLSAQVEDVVARKNFPFLTGLDRNPCAYELVKSDPVLSRLAAEKYAALEAEEDGTAALALYQCSDAEIAQASRRLAELSAEAPMKALADSLRRSGAYYLSNACSDADFLKIAYQADIRGLNRIVRIYALGEKPHYAAIDSIDFDMTDQKEISRVRSDVRSNVLLLTREKPFYSIPLRSGLTWLDVNGRSEAADYEPLAETVNKASYKAVPLTRWEDYPYSMILILGAGVHRPYETISPRSRLRARYAAELYRQGKAPFIGVSGGRVYPFKTTHTEALELKKYLMKVCGIPEEAIIADPHARHTTTNLRNIGRIILSRGIPADKAVLVTSSTHQIDYVTQERFVRASMRDLGYLPFRIGERKNGREIEFFPDSSAVQVCSLDPLDP